MRPLYLVAALAALAVLGLAVVLLPPRPPFGRAARPGSPTPDLVAGPAALAVGISFWRALLEDNVDDALAMLPADQQTPGHEARLADWAADLQGCHLSRREYEQRTPRADRRAVRVMFTPPCGTLAYAAGETRPVAECTIHLTVAGGRWRPTLAAAPGEFCTRSPARGQ